MERRPYIEKKSLTDDNIKNIVGEINNSQEYLPNTAGEYLRQRDSTIVLVACYAGLRPGEALRLRWADIDFQSNEIRINPSNNKQKNGSAALMSTKTRDILLSYKQFQMQFINSEWLFPSLITLEPLTTSAIEKRLIRIMKRIGIHKILFLTKTGQPISNVTTYSFRKYFGTKFYKKTKDPYATMRALRQTKLSSIVPYVLADKEGLLADLNTIF